MAASSTEWMARLQRACEALVAEPDVLSAYAIAPTGRPLAIADAPQRFAGDFGRGLFYDDGGDRHGVLLVARSLGDLETELDLHGHATVARDGGGGLHVRRLHDGGYLSVTYTADASETEVTARVASIASELRAGTA